MSPWTGAAAELAERIAAFVDSWGASEAFDVLALDVHRWQVRHDPVLAALVERDVERWEDIPAVPVGLFKELPVGTAPDAPVVFRTSGTTGGGRGEHHLRSTALYDRGAVAFFRCCVPDAPTDVLALLDDAPDSSLAHMVALFGEVAWFARDGVLDRAALDERVRASRVPVFLAATAFALAEWLDRDVPPLPPGSLVMVTGGFKGRVHRLDGELLLDEARRRLRADRIVTEYGMTELSSQLWGIPGEAYRMPPWMRAMAVDPDGRPAARGQLRFWDLCNLDGTLGIETLDDGEVIGDRLILHGRLADAPVRGCSLTVEEAWARRGR